jgi:hypothetical protein
MLSHKDADTQILLRIDSRDVGNVCKVNKYLYGLVNEMFYFNWLHMRYEDLTLYRKKDEKWKDYFLKVILYIEKMKLYIIYRKGDIHNYMKILKKYFFKYSADFASDTAQKYKRNYEKGLEKSATNGYQDLVEFFLKKGEAFDIFSANRVFKDEFEINYGLYGAVKGGHEDSIKFFINSYSEKISWENLKSGETKSELTERYLSKIDTSDEYDVYNLNNVKLFLGRKRGTGI